VFGVVAVPVGVTVKKMTQPVPHTAKNAPMELRQVALVAHRLDPEVAEITRVLGLEVGYRDPEVAVFGLENAVMPIGNTFLEVVSPVRPDTTAGRYLDRRGGDGGYMVIIQVDDLAPHRERVTELGVRIAWEATLGAWSGIHLHPADVGGAILSFDRTDPPTEWPPAGPDWRDHVRTDVVTEIAGVELQSDDPDRLAERWGQVLDRKVDGDRTIALDRGALRFVAATDSRPEGVGGVDLVAADRSRAGECWLLCGTRMRFV